MRNFLNAGNKGNKMGVWVTKKSIAIMILLPMLPMLPFYTPSRESRKKVYVCSEKLFPEHTPICTKRVTRVTWVTRGWRIVVFLLPVVQKMGNRGVTFRVTGGPTQ